MAYLKVANLFLGYPVGYTELVRPARWRRVAGADAVVPPVDRHPATGRGRRQQVAAGDGTLCGEGHWRGGAGWRWVRAGRCWVHAGFAWGAR